MYPETYPDGSPIPHEWAWFMANFDGDFYSALQELAARRMRQRGKAPDWWIAVTGASDDRSACGYCMGDWLQRSGYANHLINGHCPLQPPF